MRSTAKPSERSSEETRDLVRQYTWTRGIALHLGSQLRTKVVY